VTRADSRSESHEPLTAKPTMWRWSLFSEMTIILCKRSGKPLISPREGTPSVKKKTEMRLFWRGGPNKKLSPKQTIGPTFAPSTGANICSVGKGDVGRVGRRRLYGPGIKKSASPLGTV